MAIRVNSPKSTFYHPSLVGGTSIMLWLEREVGGFRLHDDDRRGGAHLLPSELYELFNETPESSGFKFCIVRNPWDRVASYYIQNMKEGTFKGSFEEFLLYSKFCKNSIIHNCYSYAKYSDYIIRFESFEKDFERIQEFYKNQTPLSRHYNKTLLSESGYTDFYVPKLINEVANIYRADIKHYGYEYGQ